MPGFTADDHLVNPALLDLTKKAGRAVGAGVKQAFVPAGDPALAGLPPGDPAAAGGAGGMPPVDPAALAAAGGAGVDPAALAALGGAGGLPPGDPAALGGVGVDPAALGGAGGLPAGGAGVDPLMVQQMVQQAVQQALAGSGGAASSGGKPLTPKIDEKVVLVQILKILARIADQLGISIPASEMIVSQQDLSGLARAPAFGGPGGEKPAADRDYRADGDPFDTTGLVDIRNKAAAVARLRRTRVGS